MKCGEIRETILRHFDDAGNDIEYAQIKQHVKACKACNDEFECLREAFDYMDQHIEIEPPADFETAVMDRIAAYEEAAAKKASAILLLLFCGTSIIFSILLALGIFAVKDVLLAYIKASALFPYLSALFQAVQSFIASAFDRAIGYLVEGSIVLADINFFLVIAFFVLVASLDLNPWKGAFATIRAGRGKQTRI